MMIATLVTAVNTSGTPALATRMTVAMTPISTAGMTGVLRTGSIRASVAPAGSALSRAMANISLIAAVCTASAHTVTAMVIEIRKTVPSVPPITCSRMSWPPPVFWPRAGSARSGAASTQNSRISPPMTNEATTARRIAVGAVRRGSTVSSPSELAVSKPYIT